MALFSDHSEEIPLVLLPDILAVSNFSIELTPWFSSKVSGVSSLTKVFLWILQKLTQKIPMNNPI